MKNQWMKINSYIGNWYRKEKRIIALSLLSGLIITFGLALYTKNYSEKIVSGISSQVIRFHVLANSDGEFDQQLKLLVKDQVLEAYSPMLNASSSIEETRAILSAQLGNIEAFAQNIVTEEGYSYPVSVSLATDKFPTKAYGDITLPAGNYEALRIEIGQASGQNWWCVMFPPLCFVDVTKNQIHPETKESLQNMLTEEEYALLDNNIRENDETVKIKFKIVEWWQEQGEDNSDDIIIAKSPGYESGEGSF